MVPNINKQSLPYSHHRGELRKIWTYKFKGRELSWGGAGRVWEGGSKCTNENSQFLKVVLIQVSLEYDAILSQWTGRAPLCLCNKKL